jgi:hypothetical protein
MTLNGRYIHISRAERDELLELLAQHYRPATPTLHGFIGRLEHGFGLSEEEEAFINAASEIHGCDEIEVDDNSVVSQSDEGAFVHAWVWVSNGDAGLFDVNYLVEGDKVLVSDPKYPDSVHEHGFSGTYVGRSNDSEEYYLVRDQEDNVFTVEADEIIGKE